MAMIDPGATASDVPANGPLLLAVDAGGTKTTACLAQDVDTGEPTILGRGCSTAGNPLSVGMAEATRAIAAAANEARENAARPDRTVTRAVLSVAGSSDERLRHQLAQWGHSIGFADQIAVVSDVWPVLAAAAEDCCGVALISGTGSVAFGRAADGSTALCGGWGYVLGDDGSGFSIGRAAVRLALTALELRAEPQPLARAVLDHVGATCVADLKRAIYGHVDPRRAVAAVAPVVTSSSDEGDAAAILDDAAAALINLVARAARAVGLAGEPFVVALSGGVLIGAPQLEQRVRQGLQANDLSCDMRVIADPLTGCLRLAASSGAAALVTWHSA